MPKKVKSYLKKYGLVIWMVLAILALVSTISFAAWTRVKRVKRVVSIQSETGMRFSSNYMSAVTPVQIRNVAMGSEDSANVEIVVRNYATGNVSRVYPYTFTYTLKATLCDSSGNPVTSNDATFVNYSIRTITDRTVPTYGTPINFSAQTVEGQTNYIATIPGNSLTGGGMDEDYFLLTFDDGQKQVTVPTYYVLLEAVLDESGEDIEDLAGYVGLYAKTSRNGWSLNAADDQSKTFGDFHGFNYSLSGSGEGVAKISWNPDELSISNLFLEEIGGSVANDSQNSGMKCVTFPVNSSDINYYDVQFYKTEDFDLSAWSAMAVGGNNVKFSYDDAKTVTMTYGGNAVEDKITVLQGTNVTMTLSAGYDSLYSVTLNGTTYTVSTTGDSTSVASGNITLTRSGTNTIVTFASAGLQSGDNAFAIKFYENGVLKIASGSIEVGSE